MAKTEAQMRAKIKWETNNYDKITVLLPKGTKDQIKATGNTLNGFISQAVMEKLEKDGK